jgi:poly(3-hydroxybutyrate) depolymerase
MQEGAPSQNGQLSPSQGVRNGGDSGLQTGSVTSGGMTRNYFIFVPSSYRAGQAVPLVLGFHGGGIGSGKGFARTTSFNQLAEQENLLLFIPVGSMANGMMVVEHPNYIPILVMWTSYPRYWIR